MKCDAYRILIQEMLRGQLNIDEAAVVASHMDACELCRSFHRGLVDDSHIDQHRREVAESLPHKPAAARQTIWQLAMAAVLAALLLGGVAMVARHVGWRGPDSHQRSWHHSHVQEHSR